MTSPVRGLSHVAFNVRDLDAAVDFYCAVLGLEKAFEMRVPEIFDNPSHPLSAIVGEVGMAYIRLGNRSFLELFRTLPTADVTAGGANSFDRGFAHLSLEVTDIRGYVEILRSRGVVIDDEVAQSTDGSLQAWIRDLDDNRIELMEYTSESLQARFF